MEYTDKSSYRAAKSLAFTVIACSLLGCSAPSYFTYQTVNYFDSTPSQAQLGNLGIEASEPGAGFQRGYFLSDCGIANFDVTVDARIPEISAIRSSFGGAKMKLIGEKLGLSADRVSNMSVVILSLNSRELSETLGYFGPACREYVRQNGPASRLVTSVAVLLDHPLLHETDAALQVRAKLGPRGAMGLALMVKKETALIVPPDAVFAYRYSRFCWEAEEGQDILLRPDDPTFEACPVSFEAEGPEGWLWPEPPALEPAPETPEGDEEPAGDQPA